MMQFRRLTSDGILEFRRYLAELRLNPTLRPPEFHTADSYSEPLPQPVSLQPVPFRSRLDFARWLDSIPESSTRLPRTDAGFWSWLSMALFDQVCPPDASGRRRPGADARHIPDFSRWTRRYRHLLANPYDVYQLHRDQPERAMVVLANPLHRPGELTEQLTSRLEIVQCPGTMALATYIFFDRSTGQMRKGAAGKSAARFGKLMNQFTRTWDLPEIRSTDFADVLPRDFRRFVRLARTSANV